MENKCNVSHKFGPFIMSSDGTISRSCLCCGVKRNNYPNDDKIKEEIVRQDDTSKLLGVLLEQKIEAIPTSDSFISLVACLASDLSYLYINEETQNKFMDRLKVFNEYHNKDLSERYQLINGFNNYLELYFKKENTEAKFGIGSFPIEELEQMDLMFVSIVSKFDLEMQVLNDKRKEHLK